MNKNIDIYAEVNPGFCSLVLYSFIKAYYKESGTPLSYPLILLPIPIILSGDLDESFKGTNIKTGFFSWVERSPNIRFKLSNRIENCAEYIKQAIEYGFYKELFILTKSGLIIPNDKPVKNYSNNKFTQDIFKRAERLGTWFGRINSEKTIFNYLEIKL